MQVQCREPWGGLEPARRPCSPHLPRPLAGLPLRQGKSSVTGPGRPGPRGAEQRTQLLFQHMAAVGPRRCAASAGSEAGGGSGSPSLSSHPSGHTVPSLIRKAPAPARMPPRTGSSLLLHAALPWPSREQPEVHRESPHTPPRCVQGPNMCGTGTGRSRGRGLGPPDQVACSRLGEGQQSTHGQRENQPQAWGAAARGLLLGPPELPSWASSLGVVLLCPASLGLFGWPPHRVPENSPGSAGAPPGGHAVPCPH